MLGPENFCYWSRPPRGIVLDVGVGRIPTFGPWLQGESDAFVVLCDPTPKHLPGLREWVRRNGRSHLVEAALGEADGESAFFESTSEESGSLDPTHVNVRARGAAVPVRLVSLRSLLGIAGAFGTVGIVKLDVEGVEFPVLGSCLRDDASLVLSVPQWLVEFHPAPQTSHTIWEVSALRRRYCRLGFRAFSPNGTDYLFWRPQERAQWT